MDERLINWARYVRDRQGHISMHPMFRGFKSTEWAVEPSIPVDQLDGHKIEKAISALPEKERWAVRWAYVYRYNPSRMCRLLGVTAMGLGKLIEVGRQMLINRSR